jgi:hypothetical protein
MQQRSNHRGAVGVFLTVSRQVRQSLPNVTVDGIWDNRARATHT